MYATRFDAAARLRRFAYMATKKKEKKKRVRTGGCLLQKPKKKNWGRIKNQETHSSHCIFRVRLFAFSFLPFFLSFPPYTLTPSI